MHRNWKFFNLNFIVWLFFYIAIFSFVLNTSFNYFDHDFPWHLRIGEQINREMAAPTIDYYNHTMLGQTFIDHEWLFNWLLFKVYDNFGYISLNILFALIVTLTIFLLKHFTQKFFLNNHFKNDNTSIHFVYTVLMLLLSTYAVISLSPFFGVRMQLLGNLFFLVMLFILEFWNLKKQKNVLFLLIPLFIIWTNLHGSFLIGLVIMWGYIICKLTEIFLKKINIKIFEEASLSYKDLMIAGIIAGLATLATLINPYGIGLYSFLSTYTNSYYMTAILEWRPFYYLPIFYNQIIIISIFTTILLLSIYFYSQKIKKDYGLTKYLNKANLWQWSLAVLFLVLALKSKRHFPLFLIASFPLIVQFIYFEFIIEIKNNFSVKVLSVAKVLFISTFSILIIYFNINSNFTNNPFNKSYSPSMPHDMLVFLKSIPNLPSKKIFNDYSWGGYFLWEIPNAKLFIDGRMPQANFENHSLIEEYMDFFEKDKSDGLLKKHNIDLVILQKEAPIKIKSFEKNFFKLNESEINNMPNHLRNYLSSSSQWKLVYEDSLGDVYIKN